MNKKLNIAIDGLSGSGKSTLAKRLAKHYNIIYVDTGALYRTVGLRIQQLDISYEDTESIINALPSVDISVRLAGDKAEVLLGGEPVGDEIRTPVSSLYASEISKIPEVRKFLLDTQRRLASEYSCVMDGRDIGTVIMPDADVKLYLEASEERRAIRRHAELVSKGLSVELSEIRDAITKRDNNDSSREVAPAVAAGDAILLDNSDMTIDETVDAAIKIINNAVAL